MFGCDYQGVLDGEGFDGSSRWRNRRFDPFLHDCGFLPGKSVCAHNLGKVLTITNTIASRMGHISRTSGLCWNRFYGFPAILFVGNLYPPTFTLLIIGPTFIFMHRWLLLSLPEVHYYYCKWRTGRREASNALEAFTGGKRTRQTEYTTSRRAR